MIDYKNTVKHLKSSTFTCINPQLASEAAVAIQLLTEQLDQAEQRIRALEDALGRREELIREYKNEF